MFDVLRSGGLLMLPIFLCAFGATFIIIERLMYFAKISKLDDTLYAEVHDLLTKGDYNAAENVCSVTETPSAKVFKKLIQSRTYSSEDIKEIASSEMARQIPQLERFLTSLGTIANISTLLGLLGTVTGNIGAFGVLGDAGTMGNPAILAGAISEALVTTASGLAVSIPAIIFHNYLASKANKIIVTMDAEISDFSMRVQGRLK